MQQCETTKLSYNKYAYKIVIKNALSGIFSSYNSKNYAKNIIDKMTIEQEQGRPLTIENWRRRVAIDDIEFEKAKKIYECLQNYSDYRTRTESRNCLIIYTNDSKMVDDLKQNIQNDIRQLYSPKENILSFLNSNIETAIIKKKIPYEFKVYLNNKAVDPSFAKWLRANTDKSRVGDTTLRNIDGGYYNNGNYFYVKNEKILTMVRMLIGQNIRRVEKLVYIEDIDK